MGINNQKHTAMKMFDAWMKLSLRVIALFFTAMLISYSPMYLRPFFADVEYGIHNYGSLGTEHITRGMIDVNWEWGFRHYLYFYMCIVLFAIQAVKIITWVGAYEDDFKIARKN